MTMVVAAALLGAAGNAPSPPSSSITPCTPSPPGRVGVGLLFTGDVLLSRGVGRVIRYAGADRLFSPSVDSLFATAQMVVANLECPATAIDAPLSKRFVFRADPAVLPALRRHGITHLNLANNHSIDQGREGLADTYHNIIKAGMTPIGYGATDAEACRPLLLANEPRPVFDGQAPEILLVPRHFEACLCVVRLVADHGLVDRDVLVLPLESACGVCDFCLRRHLLSTRKKV